MSVQEKLELEALGVYLEEGPWQYRRQDLDHARQVCLNFQADPEYAMIEGGVQIEPPRWSLEEEVSVETDPAFLARYKVGYSYCESVVLARIIYDDFPDDRKIETIVWSRYPDLYPLLFYPDGRPTPIDPLDPTDPIKPTDPIEPTNPIDPTDPPFIPPNPNIPVPLITVRPRFQVDPKIYI